jgi:hypothetical protein
MNSKGPVRLNKVESNADDVILALYHSFMNRVEAWILNHALLCLIVLMCLLMAIFVVLIFAITGVSATESGVQYNAFQRII